MRNQALTVPDDQLLLVSGERSRNVATLDFACSGSWQGVRNVDNVRHFETGQVLAAKLADSFSVCIAFQHNRGVNNLAVLLIWNCKADRLTDSRVLQQHGINLKRRDFFASPIN